jgi:hypothetical protein
MRSSAGLLIVALVADTCVVLVNACAGRNVCRTHWPHAPARAHAPACACTGACAHTLAIWAAIASMHDGSIGRRNDRCV